jgi:histidine triad (HIT) family protein
MMKKKDCIFCDDEQIKATMIFEDAQCKVILDKFPTDKGHMLVISNEHYDNMLEAPDTAVTHMYKIAKRYGKLAMMKLKSDGMTITTNIGRSAGQIVMHFHIHIIPRYDQKDPSYDFGSHREISKEQRDNLLNMFKE